MEGQEIVVWFSCGAASAIAAKLTLEKYGLTNNVRVVNNPVIEEHEDNLRFLKDVEKWLGVKIETAINSKYKTCSAADVWDDRKAMSFPMGAPCTIELKKNARKEFEQNNKIDWHVLGFTYDEKKRHERFVLGERDNVIPVLIDEKITKAQCFIMLSEAKIKMPEIYNLGYPNANCIGCVKATSPTYWNHVREVHPEIFKKRADQSRKYGVKLVRVKGERMLLDNLCPNSKGAPMKTMQFECGIFCEETK